MSQPAQTLTFEFREGSLPPPSHYEYRIVIRGDGSGEIAMTPDYPDADVPVWRETFSLPETTAAQLLQDAEAFARSLPAGPDRNPIVGGATASLSLAGRGATVSAAQQPIADDERLQRIHAALRAAVPEAVWAELARRRARYIETRPGR